MHALIIASGMVSTGFARLVKVFFFVSETLETVSVKCHYVLNSWKCFLLNLFVCKVEIEKLG